MDKKKDPIERIILEDFQMEAEKIKKEVQDAGAMPPEVKDRIRERLHEKKAKREKEQLYAQLSEEDKKALELGRDMLKKQEADKQEEKVVYFRKPKRMYVALAAVMVLVLAMSVTSVGGPKRVVQMMQALVGTREVVQIDTSDDNYIESNNSEEQAYQKLTEVFGVELVKPGYWPEGTKFVVSEIDEELQTALLIYDVKGKSVQYTISSHFTDSSWGIDLEDTVINEYYVTNEEKGKIKIIEYETKESKTKTYSANYVYGGLEYCIIGVMDKNDFEMLVKNLKFFDKS